MHRWIAGLVFGLALGVAQAGEVYRWVDKDGRVHYGDRPKAGGEMIDATPGSGPGTPAAAVQAAADRAAECERKKQVLAGYRKATSIKETDALGREREYTPQERAQLIARTQQQVDAACAPAPQAAASGSAAAENTPPAEPGAPPPAN